MTQTLAGAGPDLPEDARALLDAVVAISSDLDLHSVLDRIVVSACRMTGARYGALGVLGNQRGAGRLRDVRPHRRSSTPRSASCRAGTASSAC